MSYSARCLILLIAVIGYITSVASAENNLLSAPKGFVKLLHVNPRSGQVLRPADFDLTKPGARWQDSPGSRMVFEQIYKNYGCYQLKLDVPAAPKAGQRPKYIRREIWSQKAIHVDQNRNYIVSVLVKTNFDRQACEFNMSLRRFDAYGHRLSPRRSLGLPARTKGPDGWQRLEWTVTIPTDPRIAKARPSIFIGVRHGNKPVQLEIADYAFVELPAKALKYPGQGKGVTFPGNAGDLPMNVEFAYQKEGHIIVKTTGAEYDFDTDNSTIIASQRIAFKRHLAKWHSSLSFKGLQIDKKNDDVCVLSNNQMTIGIQRDSLLLISPKYQLTMTLTNLFGGAFNRYSRGYLYSTDDFGGITVDPYIPAGTGLKSQSKLLTKGLSFVDLTPLHALQEQQAKLKAQSDEKAANSRVPWSTSKPGAAKPGWQAQWMTLPGEFFTTSVFPPRPFNWKQSFTEGRKNILYSQKLSSYAHKQKLVTDWVLWNFIPMTWGMSYSTHLQPYHSARFHKIVNTAHSLGIQVSPYISMYWSISRNPEKFIDGIKEFKKKYHIDGIYSDGVPSANWLIAYKEMRMVRALFPSGYITVHNSMPQAGWAISQKKPFMFSYATVAYMNELVVDHQGIKWIYPRYYTSQFRKSNAFGDTKANAWYGPDGKLMGEKAALVTMVYNGRNNHGWLLRKYHKDLAKLYQLWKKYGNDPHFYDRYYLPAAQKLTGYKIGRAGMPIVTKDSKGNKTIVSLKSLTPESVIYYTTNGNKPTRNSNKYKNPISINSTTIIKAQAYAPGLDPSVIAVIGNNKNSAIAP